MSRVEGSVIMIKLAESVISCSVIDTNKKNDLSENIFNDHKDILSVL